MIRVSVGIEYRVELADSLADGLFTEVRSGVDKDKLAAVLDDGEGEFLPQLVARRASTQPASWRPAISRRR